MAASVLCSACNGVSLPPPVSDPLASLRVPSLIPPPASLVGGSCSCSSGIVGSSNRSAFLGPAPAFARWEDVLITLCLCCFSFFIVSFFLSYPRGRQPLVCWMLFQDTFQRGKTIRGRRSANLLQDGDVIEVEIEHIGGLRNHIDA